MAWRKPREPVPIEPPDWYRVFRLEDWDTPDGQEQRMIDGTVSWHPWPDHLHEVHAQRRWGEAKHAYRREHPALAEQEFAEPLNREYESRRR